MTCAAPALPFRGTAPLEGAGSQKETAREKGGQEKPEKSVAQEKMPMPHASHHNNNNKSNNSVTKRKRYRPTKNKGYKKIYMFTKKRPKASATRCGEVDYTGRPGPPGRLWGGSGGLRFLPLLQ